MVRLAPSVLVAVLCVAMLVLVGACASGEGDTDGGAGDACVPSAETCDGTDEDCDGTADEDFDVGMACTGPGACGAGVYECASASEARCSSAPGGSADASRTETCDDADNDCDGAVDEDFDVGGACTGDNGCGPGMVECADLANTRCSSNPGGSDFMRVEICDGMDNDCDANADEDFPNLGDVCAAVGECAEGTIECASDGSAQICSTHLGGSEEQATPEVCDTLDNDCNGTSDDGDPVELCAMDPIGGMCDAGTCSCPPETADVDRAVPGCECAVSPAMGEGSACGDPIDLGSLVDVGELLTVSGNAQPFGREVWYRFRGVDSADTSCDNYNVRLQFIDNPGGIYEFVACRGGCSADCSPGPIVEMNWATDFRAMVSGVLAGQCGCYALGATPASGLSVCENDSADFYFGVRVRDGATATCDLYTVEVSNGLYDSPFSF